MGKADTISKDLLQDNNYFADALDVKVVVSKNLIFCCGMIIHFGCQSLLCTWRIRQ
jgi:hypothetical protein